MKLTIISLQKVKQDFVLSGEREYLDRLRGKFQVEFIELNNDFGKNLTKQQQKDKEAELLLKKVPQSAFTICLDEQGKSFTSDQFKAYVSEKMNRGESHFCFLIGGPFGFSTLVREKTDLVLSLSKLTFPYQLTRLILVEQIYRMYTLMNNIPYHK